MVLMRYCYEQNIKESCKEELKWRARITCCKSPAKEKPALRMVVSREENGQLWCFLFDVQDLSAGFLMCYKLANCSGKAMSCSSEPCLRKEHLRHMVELKPWFFILLSELMDRTCNIMWYTVHYILVPKRAKNTYWRQWGVTPKLQAQQQLHLLHCITLSVWCQASNLCVY